MSGSDAVDRTELALSPSPSATSEQIRGKPQPVGHEHGHQPTSVAWVHHAAQERQTLPCSKSRFPTPGALTRGALVGFSKEPNRTASTGRNDRTDTNFRAHV
jgi:hypothetical protein